MPKRLLVAILLAVMPFSASSQANDYVVKEPPRSLDRFYPPQSETSEWVRQMHTINGHFGGVLVDVEENDWDNAEAHASQFVKTYEKTSGMVPEWESYFDHEAARRLAAAVKTRDMARIRKAAAAVSQTCGTCHAENSIGVWTRYHWPATQSIKIDDSTLGREIRYVNYMRILSGTFSKIVVNFEEGQYERAFEAASQLKKRIIGLRSACSKCHATGAVKQFFVGEPIVQALDSMKKEIAGNPPRPEMFWKYARFVRKQACLKCHLTHRAYAIIQRAWTMAEKVQD